MPARSGLRRHVTARFPTSPVASDLILGRRLPKRPISLWLSILCFEIASDSPTVNLELRRKPKWRPGEMIPSTIAG